MRVNCFGIPDEYAGFQIYQGADDRFYASISADTWDDLRERLDHVVAAETSMSAEAEIAVPRNLLASAAYCARKHAGRDSVTYQRLSAIAISPEKPTYADRPLSEIAASNFHPGDVA